jgi:hypothetical protein
MFSDFIKGLEFLPQFQTEVQARLHTIDSKVSAYPADLDQKLSAVADLITTRTVALVVAQLKPTLEALLVANQQLTDEIATLKTEVARDTTVMGSATTLISGFAAQLQAAIDAAVANGVDASQLTALTDLQSQLGTSTDTLAAAVAANTAGTSGTGGGGGTPTA